MSSQACKRLSTNPFLPFAIGLALAALACPTVAGESRIELRDGSVLRGELVSVSEGGYRIRSAILGEIQVRESEVIAIRPLGAGADIGAARQPGALEIGGASGGAGYKDELAAIQQRLAGDPGVMQAILSLQENPEIRAALADPAFAQLILSGNVATLSTDPRFRHLMENPAIQDILGRVQAP